MHSTNMRKKKKVRVVHKQRYNTTQNTTIPFLELIQILTRFPKNTVSIVDCGWRKLSLGEAPSQGLALRGVL